MKKITFLAVLSLAFFTLQAQTDISFYDISPNSTLTENTKASMAPWDTLFYYLMPDPNQYITSGAETDGNHIYVGGWSSPDFLKYDMDGNLIEAFTVPDVPNIKDMAYDGQYFYSGSGFGVQVMKVMDLDNKNLVQEISLPFTIRALAYNDDLDVFYANDWSTDIMVFEADGTIVDTIPYSPQTHTYKEVYGFAYDNWSAGSPYLWAFVQDGPSDATLVQLALPSGLETGFILDLSYLSDTLWTYAGGLFTYPDTAYNQVVIGGIIQNSVLFGLELTPLSPPAFPLGGEVSAGGGTLDEGSVELFHMEANEVTDILTTSIDPDGSYLFDAVVEGNYLIQAKPDMLSVTADNYVPTYLGGYIHWEDATSIFVNTGSDDKDIELIEMAALGSGIGSVDGYVYELTTDAEVPVVDAQVMLLNTSEECVALTYTDSDGAFLFENIALDDYGLLVEIAGKTMEPMAFTLTQASPQLSDVVLYVSGDGIMVGVDDDLAGIAKHIGEFYPNPSRDKASLDIRMEEAAELQLKVYAVSGQLVQDNSFVLSKGNNRISMMLSDLNSGVYYIMLDIDNKFIATRKLIKNQ